jgi:uncharacterized damage-inducible protein DinB
MYNNFIKNLAYEKWANKRIIDAMSSLPVEDERCNWLLSHILAARVAWLERIEGIEDSTAVWTTQDFETCIKLNAEIDAKYENFLSPLLTDDLQMNIFYKNLKKEAFQSTLQDIFIHIFNHSTYHRGQIICRLKELNAKIPATDYILFVREED